MFYYSEKSKITTVVSLLFAQDKFRAKLYAQKYDRANILLIA